MKRPFVREEHLTFNPMDVSDELIDLWHELREAAGQSTLTR